MIADTEPTDGYRLLRTQMRDLGRTLRCLLDGAPVGCPCELCQEARELLAAMVPIASQLDPLRAWAEREAV